MVTGEGCFALVNFERFLFYYLKFWSLQFFLLFILWVFFKNCVKFHMGERQVFAFLFVNCESFLFLYFEVPKTSIFFLPFWWSFIFFLV